LFVFLPVIDYWKGAVNFQDLIFFVRLKNIFSIVAGLSLHHTWLYVDVWKNSKKTNCIYAKPKSFAKVYTVELFCVGA
jgi:hypothetical protein